VSSATVLIALFNAAWQSTLIAVAAWAMLRRLPRINGVTLFSLWAAVLIACLSLPLLNLGVERKMSQVQPNPVPLSAAVTSAIAFHSDATPKVFAAYSRTIDAQELARTLSSGAAPFVGAVLSRSSLVLWILVAIGIVRLLRVIGDAVQTGRARMRVTSIESPIGSFEPLGRNVRFATSAEFSSPCVLGFAPALIVIPVAILAKPSNALRSIVNHELEHVRRFDDVQMLVARIVGAIAFICPGATLALRELAFCRERICDDAVIAAGGNPIDYAATLAEIARTSSAALTPTLSFGRRYLMRRLSLLLDRRQSHSLQFDRRIFVAATAALIAIATLASRMQVPVLADVLAESAARSAAGSQTGTEIHINEQWNPHAALPASFSGAFAVSRCAAPNEIQLRLVYSYAAPKIVISDDVSECVDSSQFHGLTPRDLSSITTRKAFSVVREEGTIAADGAIGNGYGRGMWRFIASRPFVAALNARGIEGVTPLDQFHLLLGNFQLATLDRLLHAGFARPTIDDLVRMNEDGMRVDLIDDALRLPMQVKTVPELLRLAEVGARPEYIANLERLGYRPSVEDVIRLREVGATIEWIDRVSRGGRAATLDELIRLREQGAE
jgi:beta-lactamase regulating signal transducer with metallopeptidase domain